MAKETSEFDILELAAAREIEAYRLYIRLSQRVSDRQIADLFKSLAAEELEHKSRIELELMKLGIAVPPTDDLLHDDNFSEEDQTVLEFSYKDMLLFAIAKERRSLRLYIELAGMQKYTHCREMLISLAENEAMHEARFEAQYNAMLRG